MIISHSKRFIFFHIGKTGGTTIQTRLASYHEDDRGFLCFDPDRFGVHNHTNYPYFLQSQDRAGQFARYFKFCFVRNPYDFLYSVFRQWIKTGLIQPVDFNAWLTSHAFVEAFNTLSLPHILEGQGLTDGVMHLYTHRDNACLMDVIGRVEFFEYEFDKICRRLGISVGSRVNANILTDPVHLDPQGTALNSKKCYKYLGKYSKAGLEIVNHYFTKDFELHGYPVLEPPDTESISTSKPHRPLSPGCFTACE